MIDYAYESLVDEITSSNVTKKRYSDTDIAPKEQYYACEAFLEMVSSSAYQNYLACRIQSEIASEGASMESIKIFDSKEMENAKNNLKEARKLYNSGEFEKALPLLKKARSSFSKIRSEIASTKNYPISAILSGLVSLFTSTWRFFKNWDKDILGSDSAALMKTVGWTKAITRIGEFFPGVLGIALAYGNLGGNIATTISNKVNSNAENKKENAGLFNSVKADLMYICNVYIHSTDVLIQSCSKNHDVKIPKMVF